MRQPFAKFTEPEDESQIDLTPMLDVVFIMLIFFVVTASFVKESGIDVNRPEAATAVTQDRANIFVAIDAAGAVWINRRRVELPQLRANIERLHAENPQGSVVIQADEQAVTKQLVAVMDAARAAGVFNISIAAEAQ